MRWVPITSPTCLLAGDQSAPLLHLGEVENDHDQLPEVSPRLRPPPSMSSPMLAADKSKLILACKENSFKTFQLWTQNLLCYTWRQIWRDQVPYWLWNPLPCWFKRGLVYQVEHEHQRHGWSHRLFTGVRGLQRWYWRKGPIMIVFEPQLTIAPELFIFNKVEL